MSVLNQSGEEQVECPLCMEPLEVDDLNFYPCTCGYQICRFCWHRIRTDENGLCPACRKAYPENPADFKPLSQEEVAKLKAEKRHKDQQRKQKITENRKHLANVRVVQRNLVFVVGLPMRLAEPEVLKRHEYFGKFGKIHKVVINQSTSYAGSQGPSASAYVTYQKADDALRAIQAVNNIVVDGRGIKTSLGTTKYCSHFMKNQACPKADCMYLHDLGDVEASFTKEEMQQGKHQDYEKKLHEQLINQTLRERKPTASPPAGTQLPLAHSGSNASLTGSSQLAGVSSSSSSSSCSSGTAPNTSSSVGGGNKSDNRRQAGTIKNKKRQTPNEESRTDRGKSKSSHNLEESNNNNSIIHNHNKPSTKSCLQVPESTAVTTTATTTTSSTLLTSTIQTSEDTLSLMTTNSNLNSSGSEDRNSRLAARSILEPDNNSFFSSNSFPKISTSLTSDVSPSCISGTNEWPPNGYTLSHMPDVLPQVHSTEDWQAAFGFGQSQEEKHAAMTLLLLNRPPPPLHHSASSQHVPPFATANGLGVVTDYSANSGNPGTLINGGETPGEEGVFRRRRLLINGHLDSGSLLNGVSQENNGILVNGRSTDDELGFDPFHETQKALAEMMENESAAAARHQLLTLHQQHVVPPPGHFYGNSVQSQPSGGSKLLASLSAAHQSHAFTQSHSHHLIHPQNQRLGSNVSSCTKLLEGLNIGSTAASAAAGVVNNNAAPPRTRLPPPGFATAPNHMNAFGLGIPRAPNNTGSKILPFMGLGSGHSPTNAPSVTNSNNGSSSPVGQLSGTVFNQQQPLQQPQSAFGMQNGLQNGLDNIRCLLPNLSGGQPAAAAAFTPMQPKGWTGGPCADWTALDPAIVSTSRIHTTAPLLAHHIPSPSSSHLLRSLVEDQPLCYQGMVDWTTPSQGTAPAQPPPGFGLRAPSQNPLGLQKQATAGEN